MEKVQDFLKRIVERFVFCDLNQMIATGANITNGDGNCNFPIVLSVFPGMELLGALTSQDKFCLYHTQNSWEYWRCFLNKVDAASYPGQKAAFNLVNDLVRNGLAHSAVSKHKVQIVKQDQLNHHMNIDQDGTLLIHSVRFAQDFMKSYDACVKPILSETATASHARGLSLKTMQERFDEMEHCYSAQAECGFWKGGGAFRTVTVTHIEVGSGWNRSTKAVCVVPPPS